MAEMLATNPLPAHVRIEKQIAGFQAPAFPALAGQLPVMPGRIKIHRVLKVTAKHYGTTPDELVSARRTQPLVHFRQVAMYVARKVTGRSMPVIAYYMGDRDHTTILHGVRAVESLLDAGDVATTVAVRQITERLQMTAGRI
jgi:chromosomal replication initiation ATPase DnaA